LRAAWTSSSRETRVECGVFTNSGVSSTSFAIDLMALEAGAGTRHDVSIRLPCACRSGWFDSSWNRRAEDIRPESRNRRLTRLNLGAALWHPLSSDGEVLCLAKIAIRREIKQIDDSSSLISLRVKLASCCAFLGSYPPFLPDSFAPAATYCWKTWLFDNSSPS
jgi:hypothetical protein